MTGHLRVLHVTPYFYPAHIYGGPIQSGYALCRALARAGCDVRVITTDINGAQRLDVPNDRDIELEDGVRARYCHRTTLQSVSVQLLRDLREFVQWADIVHLTPVYSFPTMPTLALARMYRKPVVWSPRGSLQRWEHTRKPLLKAGWETVCRHLADSRTVLHATSSEEGKASAKRMHLRNCVIPNGVDVPARTDRTPRNGALRLMFIGRIDPQKGLENLLDACSIAYRCHVPLNLKIIGSGESGYVEKLRRKILELGLSELVTMPGHLSGNDKERCFQDSDVLVLPSFRENFGMAVAEGLAHGIPVIAARGTPWQRLHAERCGWWVESNPESLAKAISAAATSDLETMGLHGRTWMASEFSWDSIATKMLDLYSSCIGSKA